MVLTEVLCTNCQGAGLELESESQAVCRFCGTANAVAGVVCLRCETINSAAAENCAGCGQALWRRCPACGARNWAGADECRNCSQPLDVTTRTGARAVATTAGRLSEQASEARKFKAIESADSQRRFGELAGIEARRQANLREAQQRRDAQQRVLLLGMGLLIVGFIVVAVVALTLTNLSR